ncbi:CG30001 [Drosophila busckii]|uniref:CG30001 n=2 Tax=Drosophila busckii TaxID=30019 RepID=A0A0M4ETG8_DROBS|nr:CG30001 [Drosophila busckii]
MSIENNLNNYAQWYKQHIGEMTYVLSKEEFQVMLNILEDSIHYECETQYIEIHAAIAISPGGKLVQAYKTKCKAHLARLKTAQRKK